MRLARPIGLAFALALLASQPAAADVITPNTLTDEYNADVSTCSLREAVQASNTDLPFNGCPTGNGADEIQLGNGTYQLARAEATNSNADGELDVIGGTTLTISHAGAGRTAIDGGDLDRVLYNQGTLTVMGLALQNGRVTNLVAGGIGSEGTMTLTDVLVTDNEILGTGFAGGVWSQPGPITMTNVTISGNRTSATGAGAAGTYLNGGATLTNVTISANNAAGGEGGGLFVGNATTATVKNTVVAGNTAPSAPDCRAGPFGSVFTSQGYNLISSSSGCAFTAATGDQLDVPAGLEGLADNGGRTSTHALTVGSNAVDKIPPASCAGLTADQRGYPRPNPASGNCDIGAYEQFLCNGTPLNAPGPFTGTCPALPPVANTPPGNPTSPINPAGNVRKRKCKKKQKGASAARRKCRKRK